MATRRRSCARLVATLAFVAALAAGSACDDGVVFPADYASTYEEVRDCRPNGGSHNFNQIRVLVDPAAWDAYMERQEPFPVGAVVLKEEYDPSDTECAGEPVSWSAMQRLEDGNDELLNWTWQQVDSGRAITSQDEPRCYGCHAGCAPPDGYENTCTVP